MYRKLCTIAIVLLLSVTTNTTFASHLIGFDLELINIRDANNLPTTNYKWRLRFYRDPTGISIPNSFNFDIFKTVDNSVVGSFTMAKINPQTFIKYPNIFCVPFSTQNRIELGIYESASINYSGLNSPGGYYASSTICCRNSGIVNVQGESGNYNASIFLKFPRLDLGSSTAYNSSPKIVDLPYSGFYVGQQYTIDCSATDIDGDSLVYSMVLPRQGGPYATTITDIPPSINYSLSTNIADGAPDFSIDPHTGIVVYKPTMMNLYLIAIRVEEYRKIAGVPTKIGEVRREMQIQTVLSNNFPPKLYDALPNTTVHDTTYVNAAMLKKINFKSNDYIHDTVFIKIIPDSLSISNNILDTTIINATWGDTVGTMYSSTAAALHIIKGKGSALAQLRLNIDSNNISSIPYKFKVVSYDNSCTLPLTDTLYYELMIHGNRCFKTLLQEYTACDSFANANGITYYQSTILTDTINSKIGCDSIIITNINIIQNPAKPIITGNTNIVDTTAIYSYSTTPQTSANYHWDVPLNAIVIEGINAFNLKLKWTANSDSEEIVCRVSNGICSDSASVIVNVNHFVGLNTSKPEGLSVFPNPVNDLLNIDASKTNENDDFYIYNSLGQLVLNNKVNHRTINVSDLPKGIYYIIINTNNINYSTKFYKL